MPIPIAPVAVALTATAAAAAARRLALRRARIQASKSILLVGASASGKTSLARAMSDQSFSLESAPTNKPKRYSWTTTATGRTIHLTDMPGADAHRAWQQQISKADPDLVCLLVDYERVLHDEEAYRDAEILAAVIRDMAPKQPRALVLTHTDLVEQTNGIPRLAVHHKRSQLLARKLVPKNSAGGSLGDPEGAKALGQEVISWLQ